MHWSKDIVTEPIIVAGSTVLVFNGQGHILLQREIGTVEWSTAAGLRESSESLEDTAARILYEETGIQVNSYEFVTLMSGTDIYTNQLKDNANENYDVLAIFKVQVFEEEEELESAFINGKWLERKYFSLQEPLPPLDSLTEYVSKEVFK